MPTSEYYPIAKGDSLSSIAAKYGLTLDDVMGTNPWITNPNQISAGDYLYLNSPVATHSVVRAGNRDALHTSPSNNSVVSGQPRLSDPDTNIPTRYVSPMSSSGTFELKNAPPANELAVDNTPPVIAPADYDLGEIVVTAPRYREPYSAGLNLSSFAPAPNFGPEIKVAVDPVRAPAQNMDLLSMYEKYAPPLTDYSADLKAAAAETKAQQNAFNESIKALMNQQVEGPSKAELYFRLAAAFSEPTKTGHFMESVGKAGTVLAEHGKEQRVLKQAQRSEALKLGLEKQKLDLTNAKDRETTLRTLAVEDAKSRREMAKEIIKDYVASGRPQSAAGKQALDEGYVAGTPEYQARVVAIGNLLVEKQMAAINASLASTATQQGQLALGQKREARAERAEGRLTPQELDLKVETEDAISMGNSALDSLNQALALNPKTFDASLGDLAQRKALEAVGSKDPLVINTRNMENLLQQQALSQLKSLVGGNPTEGERAVIMDLQGVGAKSIEERGSIIRRAIQAVEKRLKEKKTRLDNINKGRYRQTTGE